MDRIDPESLVRGVLPSLSWSAGSRLPAAQSAKLTHDTVRAARVPAGVHLAFTGTATALDFDVRLGERTSVPAPGVPLAFVVRAGRLPVSVVPVPGGDGTVRIPLPEREPGEVVRVYLPEAVEVRVDGVSPVGGSLAPAPRGPLWVVYGDSISQGWSVTECGLAWPSLVAAGLGLDLVNLGFAGAARGELQAADVVGASEAAAVAVAWGTNAWSSLPTDAAQIGQTMRVFLTALRQGLPRAPVVVVSPIRRPDAEDVPNRFGATHAELRTALEEAVDEFAVATGDERITLVRGLGLVPDAELADGLHPGDDGHRSLAAGVAPHVAAGLGLPA
ncbi:SGNH/GDSL hydrolase family protein [Amycolatopsis sp. NBRC 101858]|uniref:SGNH/GDSL hydrolase family protein n=1 Tax=Amycolatopsis sp. NBRC 101858 TaxID=3032200 RepID=UPI002555F9BA|nr:SGNH/GDSL hydrolase family protein [Amycolatopsis sp. NBRC 101858]